MSRSTFREKQSDICWQKQVRDAHIPDGAPDIDLNLKRAVVRSVTRKMAEQIILKYEWLGTLPFSCNAFYGIFFGSYCAGVTCVSIGGGGGANVYAYKEFGLKHQKELAYLQRGANVHWSPIGANSKLISWTCKLLVKNTAAKLIVAYSDTDAGEIGTVYQACNWICIGRGSSAMQWVSPDGRIMDQKLPSNLAKSKGGTRKQWCAALYKAGWHEQESNPKWRYVFVLDKSDGALVNRVEKMRVPYPKRVMREGSADSGTVGDQPAGGGANPTPSLLYPVLQE